MKIKKILSVLMSSFILVGGAFGGQSLAFDDFVEVSPYFGTGSDGGTHKAIASQAIYLLSISGQSKAYNLLNTGGTMYSSEIIKYAWYTDRMSDWTQGGSFTNHYYGPYDSARTPKGYNNGVNASTSMIQAYKEAIRLYKNGNPRAAYQYLGIAVHFLSDINAPHHAQPADNTWSNHSPYEQWLNNNMGIGYYHETYINSDTFSYMLNTSFSTIANQQSAVARSTFFDCNNYYNSSNSNYRQISQNATISNIKRAERCSAGLIYRFMKETGQI